ncbi:IS5/IS1182 family transposase, partial [Micromonospora sp. GCM10011541]
RPAPDCPDRQTHRAGLRRPARRWVVERTFAWISKHRRCVRDYETKPGHHEAMIHIAMIMTMSRRLARTGNW